MTTRKDVDKLIEISQKVAEIEANINTLMQEEQDIGDMEDVLDEYFDVGTESLKNSVIKESNVAPNERVGWEDLDNGTLDALSSTTMGELGETFRYGSKFVPIAKKVGIIAVEPNYFNTGAAAMIQETVATHVGINRTGTNEILGSKYNVLHDAGSAYKVLGETGNTSAEVGSWMLPTNILYDTANEVNIHRYKTLHFDTTVVLTYTHTLPCTDTGATHYLRSQYGGLIFDPLAYSMNNIGLSFKLFTYRLNAITPREVSADIPVTISVEDTSNSKYYTLQHYIEAADNKEDADFTVISDNSTSSIIMSLPNHIYYGSSDTEINNSFIPFWTVEEDDYQMMLPNQRIPGSNIVVNNRTRSNTDNVFTNDNLMMKMLQSGANTDIENDGGSPLTYTFKTRHVIHLSGMLPISTDIIDTLIEGGLRTEVDDSSATKWTDYVEGDTSISSTAGEYFKAGTVGLKMYLNSPLITQADGVNIYMADNTTTAAAAYYISSGWGSYTSLNYSVALSSITVPQYSLYLSDNNLSSAFITGRKFIILQTETWGE